MADFGYKIDIAFVIDRTRSTAPIMTNLKESIFLLLDKLCETINTQIGFVKNLRVRVIDYGDFAIDGKDAIHATDFLTLPAEKDKLEQAINEINSDFHYDKSPKNGLEALLLATNSKWVSADNNERVRHVVIVMSDTLPLHLGERDGCEGYNKDNYPSNIEDIASDSWVEYDSSGRFPSFNKRFVLFTTVGADDKGHSWEPINNWDCTTALNVASLALDTSLLDTIIEEIIREIF